MADAYDIVVKTATGGWQSVTLNQPFNEIRFQMRDDVTALQIAKRSGGAYFTMKAGKSLALNCKNFESETIWYRATAGTTVEMLKQQKL